MKYRIEIMDADSSGILGAGSLLFQGTPVLPSVGDYMPIAGAPYQVARRDFFYAQEECVVCIQLRRCPQKNAI
jgi:hypothetical protein